MAKNKKPPFLFQISGNRRFSSIKPVVFFNSSYVESEDSPIDLFDEKKINNLRLLGSTLYNSETKAYEALAQLNNPAWNQLSNLVILGFVSSVESYCRCIIRRLIILDKECQTQSYKQVLTYGAALFHGESLLPEALLEGTSFHRPKNIKDTISQYLGIQILDNKDTELKEIFENYDIVGHLRNCVVHRSGLLGSNNALALGIDEHNSFLEKPIELDLVAIQEIGFVCDNLIKLLNDRLFSKVLYRSSNIINWTGDLRKDKKYFEPYFRLFCPKVRATNDELKKSYKELMQSFSA